MGISCVSAVSLGFAIPTEKLYSLLRVLREHDVEGKAPKKGLGRPVIIREFSPPRDELPEPGEEADYEMGDTGLEDLFDRMQDAMILADSEVPNTYQGPLLSEVIAMMVVCDEQAGNTIACYYSGILDEEGYPRREYMLQQSGHPDYSEPRSVCMGNTISERVLKGIPEGMGEKLRKALYLQEAGIEVEDQLILLSFPA